MAAVSSNRYPPTGVIIPAAGFGTRMGGTAHKLLHPLAGVPVIVHTLRVFHDCPAVTRMVLVVGAGEAGPAGPMQEALNAHGPWPKLQQVVTGGAQRQDSVARGLAVFQHDPPPWILVHDGARPLCGKALLGRVLEALTVHGAVVPTLPVQDTLRRVEQGSPRVVERSGLVRCQTPQGFHWPLLWQAHRQAEAQGFRGTDEAQVVEAAGGTVHLIAGEARNLKITTAQDLEWAQWWAGGFPPQPGPPAP